MKKKLFLVIILILLGWFYFLTTENNLSFENPGYSVENLADSASFTLKKGDILARPNWSWLPGSSPVKGGRKFGHVALVTEDVSGKTIDDVLAKTTVIEALFYDQYTHKFLFREEGQIREGKASMAFGNRFKGVRFRLRASLSEDEAETIIRFMRNQLDGGYTIFSHKKVYATASEKLEILQNLRQANWHCATLTWEAFYLAAGLDIDSNQGWLIYPSDIITSKYFDLHGGRLRF